MKLRDLTGERFGRLVVLGPERVGPYGGATWHCRCDCGTPRTAAGHALESGKVKSCGCLHRDTAAALGAVNGAAHGRRMTGRTTPALTLAAERRTLHGQAKRGKATPLYLAWQSMLGRCENPGRHNYARYGGRGIRVCERWRASFEAFEADVGPHPGEGYSLDRFPDNNGHYEPGNVRWATRTEQQRNRDVSVFLERDGVRLNIMEWAERLGLEAALIRSRKAHGCSDAEALRPNEGIARGEKNPSAKLTADDVAALRSAAADGASIRALSARFGVCRSSVRNILAGRSWRAA